MFLLILYVLLALSVSFLCSLLESVLLSITPSYVALLEERGHRAAASIRTMKEDVEQPLAAILSLNTVAHTVGAAGAGAQAAVVFGSGAVGIFSAVLTLLVLLLSEIVPKTLGASHWKRLAPYTPPVLRVLMVSMWPLVKLAEWFRRILSPRGEGPAVSREEITALAAEGEREGVVAEAETRVLSNLLRLARLHAEDVMTPMAHVVSLRADTTVGALVARLDEYRFSRMPLQEPGSAACPTRYVMKDDILARAARDEHDVPLGAVGRELLMVPARTPLPALFDRMAERREHIAMVVTEGGEPTGLVTMEDIIETLLGMEIFDESDPHERIHSLARRHWQRRAERLGLVPVDG